MDFNFNPDLISAILGAITATVGVLAIALPKHARLQELNDMLNDMTIRYSNAFSKERQLNEGLTQELAAQANLVK